MTTQEINTQIITHQLQTAERTIGLLRQVLIKYAVMHYGFNKTVDYPEDVADAITQQMERSVYLLTPTEALELKRTLVGGVGGLT